MTSTSAKISITTEDDFEFTKYKYSDKHTCDIFVHAILKLEKIGR